MHVSPAASALASPSVPHGAPGLYRRRRPEKTDYYRLVSGHLETYLAQRQAEEARAPAHVEDTFRAFLRCGLLAHGFARVRCQGCGHEFLVAFSSPPASGPS